MYDSASEYENLYHHSIYSLVPVGGYHFNMSVVVGRPAGSSLPKYQNRHFHVTSWYLYSSDAEEGFFKY